MTNKTIFEQLNDEVCDNVSLLINTEKLHFEKAKLVVSGYLNHIGYRKEVKLLHLDANINPVGVINDKYFESKISCLSQDDDGFWNIGFLLEFAKKYNEELIEPKDSTIIGIKAHHDTFLLKLLNGKETYDMSKPEELLEFYGKIIEEVKSDFSLDLMLKNKKSKKIGF
jgi:hypothetical protein